MHHTLSSDEVGLSTSDKSMQSYTQVPQDQLSESLEKSSNFMLHMLNVARMSTQSNNIGAKRQSPEPALSSTNGNSQHLHSQWVRDFAQQQNSSKVLFRFLNDSAKIHDTITYAQFLHRTLHNAKSLLNHHNLTKGDRVLILCDPGPDFIYAFFAAIFAGLIAVPSYPPWDERAFEKLAAISRDCAPTAVLISQEYHQQILPDIIDIEQGIQLNYSLKWIPLDKAHNWELSPQTTPHTPPSASTLAQSFEQNLSFLSSTVWNSINTQSDAFLQYTSGSTGLPKGVRVSHGNILAHTHIILKAWEYNVDDSSTSWLPPYHDMQLLGTIMCSAGFMMTSTIMSPLTFLHNPFLWLQTISKYKSTGSGGPNFAYELCVAKITDEQVRQLDLSSWQIAYCGAEAVKQETLERFTKKFAPCGFNPSAYYPCYGLAEATLLVAGGVRGKSALSITVDAEAYLRGEVRLSSAENTQDNNSKLNGNTHNGATLTMVSSGFSNENVQHVEIVDRNTKELITEPYKIGEIWIKRNDASPVGYWNQEDKSKQTFNAKTSTLSDSHNEYTITGDLGFFGPNRSLFVSGRSKDLIIIRGRNIYPPDVEEDIHPLSTELRKGCAACFSIDGDQGTEEMIFIAEIKNQAPQEQLVDLAKKIRQQIMRRTGVQPKEIVFIAAKSIPKTTSGKVRRFECRQWYLEDKLSVIFRFKDSIQQNGTPLEVSPQTTSSGVAYEQHTTLGEISTLPQIQNMIIENLRLKTGLVDIDATTPFMDLGLDSLKSVELMSELSRALKRTLAPTVIFQYPTVEKLSKHLYDTKSHVNTSPSRGAALGHQPTTQEPVAVIGMACRFPDANNYNEFWQNIAKGKNSIHSAPSHITDERAERFSEEFRAGFLKDVYSFDASYFGISAREAQAMDPQQRIILELAAEALLDASFQHDADSLTGVFVGATNFDFSHLSFAHAKEQDRYLSTGSSGSIISNRVSYQFDFRGPSMTIDTACSSSLVAIHEACKSLHNGECRVALAGGVNVLLSETITDNLDAFLSPDAQCRAFDDSANGYVRGEGAGLLVLKPLSHALRDGNRIHGVIKASLVSQDGKSNGITAPSQTAQQQLIQRIYSENGIDVNSVQYVEAHGTGTRLGDPIEAHALSAAFQGRQSPLLIGSVKSNIGHLEAAAGIAGVVKALMSMRHRILPPTLHFEKPNSLINFSKLGLSVVSQSTPWHSVEQQRCCGVSSFGFGGTLAHIVLEEAPSARQHTTPTLTSPAERDVIILISANSSESLPLQVRLFAQWLTKHEDSLSYSLLDISHATLSRIHHKYRVAFTGQTREDLIRKMESFISPSQDDVIMHRVQDSNQLCFVFPGQGPDISSQCKPFLAYSSFSDSLEECSQIIAEELHIDLNLKRCIETGKWNDMDCIENQLVRVATQIALVKLWKYFGIEPTVVCGHSLGEISAAYSAGFISLRDTLRIVYHRAKALNQLQSSGGMIIVRADADTVHKMLDEAASDAVIASYNAPTSITIAGSSESLTIMARLFTKHNISHKSLDLNVPYHSPIINQVADQMRTVHIEGSTPHTGVQMFSTVSGKLIGAGNTLDSDHWCKNMTQPVLFHQCLTNLYVETKCESFVEISGREMFAQIIRQIISRDVCVIPSAFRSTDISQDLHFLSHLACRGIQGVQWEKLSNFTPHALNQIIPLPTYMWSHELTHLPSFVQNLTSSVRFRRFDPDLKNLISLCTKKSYDGEVTQLIANQQTLESVCDVIVMRAMRQLGWSFSVGETYSVSTMIKRLCVAKQHERLFTHLLTTTFQNHHLITLDSDGNVSILEGIPESVFGLSTDPDLPLEDMFKLIAETPETQLLSRSAASLPEVLRGTVSSLQVLFPNGSLDTAESLYESSVSSKVYNESVSKFVRAVLESAGDNPLNILEIGGGTAGLTSHIVNDEQINIAEYMFTDISRLFTLHAQGKFADFPFMKYAQLDIERSPFEQSFEQKYDIILAANVLHATQNLAETLSNVQRLLSANGILILLEVTRPSLFLDLTFGLTEGWWRFQDTTLRSSYPLLNVEQWSQLMLKSGYRHVHNLTENCSLPFQSIIVAQSSGERFTAASSVIAQRVTSTVVPELSTILGTLPQNPSMEELVAFVQNVVAHTLMLRPSDVHPSEKLTNLGMDSLTALELKNIVQRKLNVELSLSSFDEDASVLHIAELVHKLTTDTPLSFARAQSNHDVATTLDEHISTLLSDYEDDIPTTPPAILAMGIGEAPFMYQQSEMMAMCQEFYRDRVSSAAELNTIQAIFNGSDIETRRSVIDFYKLDASDLVTSFQKRNDIYEREAIKLAEKSATEALRNWGGDRKNITHVVSVSTTGEQIPGIEFLLVDKLGLSRNVERVAVNLMGCFGALPGLKTAVALARLSKRNRVLLVSTELCSPHMEAEPTKENFVGAAIFADGSGAAIIGCGPYHDFEKPKYQILKTQSQAVPESTDKMGWKVTDEGWKLTLSKEIPALIHDAMGMVADRLLGSVHRESVDWALHPGGKAILLATESALGITKEQTQESWNIMRRYGNMSSATIMHVLHQYCHVKKSDERKKLLTTVVFGPGLTIEAGLLRRMD